jgi:signal transduction histidine kinase
MSTHVSEGRQADSIQVLSHNLKGPVHYQVNMIQFLLSNHRKLDSEDLDMALKVLLESSESIKAMLDNLMKFAVAKTNAFVPHYKLTELPTLINNEVSLATPFYNYKVVQVIINHTGNTIVNTDPDMIRVILQNLLSNALKFTYENGVVHVSTKVLEDHWELTVTDSGVGISDHIKSKILTDDQESKPGTNEEPGLGMGLSIIKILTTAMDASIDIQSAINKGTKITIKFPHILPE